MPQVRGRFLATNLGSTPRSLRTYSAPSAIESVFAPAFAYFAVKGFFSSRKSVFIRVNPWPIEFLISEETVEILEPSPQTARYCWGYNR